MSVLPAGWEWSCFPFLPWSTFGFSSFLYKRRTFARLFTSNEGNRCMCASTSVTSRKECLLLRLKCTENGNWKSGKNDLFFYTKLCINILISSFFFHQSFYIHHLAAKFKCKPKHAGVVNLLRWFCWKNLKSLYHALMSVRGHLPRTRKISSMPVLKSRNIKERRIT